MYRVGVRDHFMIAHSFRGETFGPAQKLHGATYVVDVEVARPTLDEDGIVVDIGRFSETLKEILTALNFRNLDDESEFNNINTTTEFLAQVIFNRITTAIDQGLLGQTARELSEMRVTLHESHIAWASYEGVLNKR